MENAPNLSILHLEINNRKEFLTKFISLDNFRKNSFLYRGTVIPKANEECLPSRSTMNDENRTVRKKKNCYSIIFKILL